MIGSKKVRAARKKAQLARLKKKDGDSSNYPAYYAALPPQVAMAEANDKIRAAGQVFAEATETLQVAEIDGKGLLEAQEKLTVARLVLEKLTAAARPNAQISLTAAGGA